ncbi:hypothetical protein [Soonwooa purpurea]
MKHSYNFFWLFFIVINNFSLAQTTFINVKDIGILPVQHENETDDQKYERWFKIQDLFHYARENKINLFFSSGLYDVGNRNFPFRSPDTIKNDKLLDCGNIIISGEKGTIFKTSSVYGADVLQLNQLKNITFKNLEITAELKKYEKSGSNGISITNGFDNITLENIHIYNLPGVDKGNWVDGSKGLTIQSDIGSKGYMGILIAKNIKVENVAYGFRMDTGHVSDIMKNYKTININIEMTVEKAFQGFSVEFGKSLNNIPQKNKLNFNVNAKLSNCQQYVRFARVIGGNFSFVLENTQNYYEKTTDKFGKKWLTIHDGIFGFLSYYTKNAQVSIKGNVGDVDNKIWIGAVGSIIEPYNLGNRTEYNIFNFDIAGKAKDEEIKIINYAGESLNNNLISMSKNTVKNIPPVFFSNNNQLRIKY